MFRAWHSKFKDSNQVVFGLSSEFKECWASAVDSSAVQIEQLNLVITEQLNTIKALNTCINGEESTTTENIRIVDRLETSNSLLSSENAALQDALVSLKTISTVSFRPDDGWPMCDGYMVGKDDGTTGLSVSIEEAVTTFVDKTLLNVHSQ